MRGGNGGSGPRPLYHLPEGAAGAKEGLGRRRFTRLPRSGPAPSILAEAPEGGRQR